MKINSIIIYNIKVNIWLALTFLTLAVQSSYSEVINIQGHYDETRQLNNWALHVAFSVTLSTNACRVYATNTDDTSIWETVVYDGTNTYVLTPIAGHFRESKGRSVVLGGIVSPGRLYYMLNNSLLDSYIPWIAYCMPPQSITPATHLPTVPWRENIGSYGMRWKDIVASPDGRFLQGFSFVRDKSLDLDYTKEFLRPTFEYPSTIDIGADDSMQLNARKNTPDGFIGRTYVCKQWYETNGFTIPASAEVKSYLWDGAKSIPIFTTTIQVDKITVSKESATTAAPPLAEETYVRDYRYTKRDEIRMFPYAEYVGSGSWKSDNDHDLLAQAKYYMKSGPKIGEMRLVSWQKSRRQVLIWLLLLLVSAVAIAALVQNKLK